MQQERTRALEIKLTPERLKQYIDELIAHEALELQESEENVFVPYMLNDGVECFLRLTEASVAGTLPETLPEDSTAELLTTDDISGRKLLLLRCGYRKILSVEFTAAFEDISLYQYHRDAHFWICDEYAHLRRLVYIIGSADDKSTYLGSSMLNAQEKELVKLIDFGPFRAFSPIQESMDEYYHESIAGCTIMEKIAETCGCRHYARLVKLYRILRFTPVISRLTPGVLQRKLFLALKKGLTDRAGEPLYRHIEFLINEASIDYAPRHYGAAADADIEARRQRIEAALLDDGYHGSYPCFEKGSRSLTVYEEHPFTRLDWADFHFRFSFLICETDSRHIQRHVEDCPFS